MMCIINDILNMLAKDCDNTIPGEGWKGQALLYSSDVRLMLADGEDRTKNNYPACKAVSLIAIFQSATGHNSHI